MKTNELINYIPQLPFIGFKWRWACYACTEGINDPVVLLGVLFRMAKLEGKYKYSSDEFSDELIQLDNKYWFPNLQCPEKFQIEGGIS